MDRKEGDGAAIKTIFGEISIAVCPSMPAGTLMCVSGGPSFSIEGEPIVDRAVRAYTEGKIVIIRSIGSEDEPRARPGEASEPEQFPNRKLSTNPPGNPGL